jgi:hypothetical protein
MSTDQPLVERIFGANWRTSISGLSTTLSAIVVALATLDPNVWKSPKFYVPAALVAIAKTIKDLNTKDSCVAGTGAPADPHRVDDGIAAEPRKLPVPLLLAFLLPALFFAGCTTYDDTDGHGSTVHYSTMAHNRGTTFYYPNGQPRAHWDDNDNVAVWDAAGRFVGSVASGIAEGLIAHGVGVAVQHGAVNGVQLITAAIPPAIQKVSQRKTNRVPSTPAPTPKPASKPQASLFPFPSSVLHSRVARVDRSPMLMVFLPGFDVSLPQWADGPARVEPFEIEIDLSVFDRVLA